MNTEEALQRLATEIRNAIPFADDRCDDEDIANKAVRVMDIEVEEAFNNLCNAIREDI